MIIRANFSRGKISRLQTIRVCRSCEIVPHDQTLTDCPECGTALTAGIQDGDIVAGNFHQSKPHTGMTDAFDGITCEVQGNGMNCDFPDNVTHTKGLGSSRPGGLHKSLCSHLHAVRLECGELDECAEECEHFVERHTVEIDGVEVANVPVYADKVVD